MSKLSTYLGNMSKNDQLKNSLRIQPLIMTSEPKHCQPFESSLLKGTRPTNNKKSRFKIKSHCQQPRKICKTHSKIYDSVLPSYHIFASYVISISSFLSEMKK